MTQKDLFKLKRTPTQLLALVEGTSAVYYRILKKNRQNQSFSDESSVPFPVNEENKVAEDTAESLDKILSATQTENQSVEDIFSATCNSIFEKTKCKDLIFALPSHLAVYSIFSLPGTLPENELESPVQLKLEELSPFDSTSAATSYEVLGQLDGNYVIFGASTPLSSLKRWSELITASDCEVAKIDSTLLTWLRGIREKNDTLNTGRQLVIIDAPMERVILVLESGILIAARGINAERVKTDYVRELLVAMSNAELNFGAKPLDGCMIFTDNSEVVSVTQPLLPCQISLFPAEGKEPCTLGLALRSQENAHLDLTPVIWRTQAHEKAVRKIFIISSIVIGILWILAALMLFAMPRYYAHKRAVLEEKIKNHQKQYDDVMSLRQRVNLIRQYTVRDYSALEMLRLICQAKPQSTKFLNLTFRQKQSIKISGETGTPDDIYSFKDKLEKEERISSVKINRLVQDKRTGLQRFDVEILVDAATEEESAK